MTSRLRSRLYIGLTFDSPYVIFRATDTPTAQTTGSRFMAVIGPFRTRRGAVFMRDHGRNNPHVCCVADAERIAKRIAEKGR